MSNVKAFVAKRQHGDVFDERRQAIGDQHRVLVPPTRLNRAASNPMEHKANVPLFNVPPTILKRESVDGQDTDGFDTDAESIDDTTIMSIAAKSNSHPQAVRFHTPIKNIPHDANGGARSLHASSRSPDGPAQVDNETNAFAYDSEGSSEGDDKGTPGYYSISPSLINDFRSQEFANFKKQNLLGESLIHAFQPRKPVPGMGTAAIPNTPVRSRRVVGPSLSKPSTPTREHPGHTPNLYPQYQIHNVQKIERLSQTGPSGCASDMDQTAQSPLNTNKHRGAPAGVGMTRQLPNRASHPSPRHTQSDASSTHNMVKPRSVDERLVKEKKLPRRVESDLDNHTFTISELSDDDEAEKVIEKESNQGSLKRIRSLDHSRDQLTAMTFQQLRDESFDHLSTSATSTFSPDLAKAPLHAQLEHIFLTEGPVDQDGQQQAFFGRLAIEQYVESGDLIRKKLGEVIAKLSCIRQEKREVAGKFEVEIAKREAVVRTRMTALRKDKIVMTEQTEELMAGRKP